jgi:hypothetical protein
MSSFLTDFRRLVVTGLAVLCPALAHGQVSLAPAGAEFLLGGPRSGSQSYPGLAVGSLGGCVAWQDNGLGTGGWGIMARRLDVAGNPLGAAFQVNASGAYNQQRPQVAALGNGGAAFVWQGGPVGFQTVYARFMNAAGSFLTGDVLVSHPLISTTARTTTTLPVYRNNRLTARRFLLYTLMSQRRDTGANPVAAGLADGNVAVAYAVHQRLTTNSPVLLPQVRLSGKSFVTNSILVPVEKGLDLMQEIYLRRYTREGVAVGSEVRANQFTRFSQRNPALASLANGNFILAWVSENQGVTETNLLLGASRQDIYGRLFNSAGVPLTDEFRLNDPASSQNGFPVVAALAGGGFRLAWAQASGLLTDGMDIMTRAFDANGTPLAAAQRVNTWTRGDQFAPAIAACPAGELIVWTSMGQDGSAEGIYGQWISAGALTGAEFRVNTSTALSQYQPTVGAGPGSSLVVGWAGYNPGNHTFDIFGQRYSASNP